MTKNVAVAAHAMSVTAHLQKLRTDGAKPHEIQALAESLLQQSELTGFTVALPRVLPHADGPRLQVAYWNGGAIPDAIVWLT